MVVNKNCWAARSIGRWWLPVLLGCVLTGPLPAQTNHTVKAGESLDVIGRRYGISPADIARQNELANPDLIRVGMVLEIPESTNAPTRYTVVAGDTLGSIAIAHKTTVRDLSDLNNISDPRRLRIGQVLQIPAEGAARRLSLEERYPLPPEIKRQLDAVRMTKGRWKYIVVHHSASTQGTLHGMDMYHRQRRKMENGLAYHFVIGNGRGMADGAIEAGNRWRRQIKGGHLSSDALNEVALGICLVGNFEVDVPSAAQMQSLYALVAYLMRRGDIPRAAVRTHKQINTRPTACPGARFPTKTMNETL